MTFQWLAIAKIGITIPMPQIDEFEEVHFSMMLHDHLKIVRIFVNIQYLDYIWMIYGQQYFNFFRSIDKIFNFFSELRIYRAFVDFAFVVYYMFCLVAFSICK